ncbi:MAG: M48 family metallopeptidase [Planctomycetota bacterium]|jgi:heat shock protein HtpX
MAKTPDLGLFDHIDQNRRKSVILIIGNVIVLGIVGGVLGAALGAPPWGGIAIAAAVGIVMALVAWGQGSNIMLAVAGAKEIGKYDDPELVNVVEEMCIASGLPRPRIFLMETHAMNAFATGMKPENSAVAVTRGLREALTREELQGVVAHELAHVGNRDTRVMVLMAVIVGSVAILSDFFLRTMFWTGGTRRSSSGKGNAAIAIVGIVLAIIAPLAAAMIQLAVSRKREYLADATGAAMTRNPGALADALEKLGGCKTKLEVANRGTQHLFVVNPFRIKQQANSPFATHPPIQERIRRLRALTGRYDG